MKYSCHALGLTTSTGLPFFSAFSHVPCPLSPTFGRQWMSCLATSPSPVIACRYSLQASPLSCHKAPGQYRWVLRRKRRIIFRSYAVEQAVDNYLQDSNRNAVDSFDLKLLSPILFRHTSTMKFNCVAPNIIIISFVSADGQLLLCVSLEPCPSLL